MRFLKPLLAAATLLGVAVPALASAEPYYGDQGRGYGYERDYSYGRDYGYGRNSGHDDGHRWERRHHDRYDRHDRWNRHDRRMDRWGDWR